MSRSGWITANAFEPDLRGVSRPVHVVDENQSELRLDVLESVELHEPVATRHQFQRRASMVGEEVAENAVTLWRSLAR